MPGALIESFGRQPDGIAEIKSPGKDAADGWKHLADRFPFAMGYAPGGNCTVAIEVSGSGRV